jgi:hypothetical protein
MWRVGIGSAAALILLTNGLLEGVLTNRWHRPVELEKGLGRVKRIPMTIGDWRGQADDLDDAVMTRAGIEGYFYGHYENQFSGKKITVLLMCGRPGPLAVHTPDICYRGAGYHQEGSIAKWQQEYGNASAEFRRAKFSKDDATNITSLRIAWTWGTAGKWVAPTTPRTTFARLPVLYKLYIVHRESASSERADEEVCKGFLEQLLPALDNALYADD